MIHQPRRGDDVEAWLKHWRDLFDRTGTIWIVLDQMLDEYRLCNDTGENLRARMKEGG